MLNNNNQIAKKALKETHQRQCIKKWIFQLFSVYIDQLKKKRVQNIVLLFKYVYTSFHLKKEWHDKFKNVASNFQKFHSNDKTTQRRRQYKNKSSPIIKFPRTLWQKA